MNIKYIRQTNKKCLIAFHIAWNAFIFSEHLCLSFPYKVAYNLSPRDPKKPGKNLNMQSLYDDRPVVVDIFKSSFLIPTNLWLAQEVLFYNNFFFSFFGHFTSNECVSIKSYICHLCNIKKTKPERKQTKQSLKYQKQLFSFFCLKCYTPDISVSDQDTKLLCIMDPLCPVYRLRNNLIY